MLTGRRAATTESYALMIFCKVPSTRDGVARGTMGGLVVAGALLYLAEKHVLLLSQQLLVWDPTLLLWRS
jgi:hypothetical protein